MGTGGAIAGTGGATATGGVTAGGECTPDTKGCSNDTLVTCGDDGRWPAQGTACPLVCRNNACGGECRPGTHSCSKRMQLTCDADGNWPAAGTTCTYVCCENACTGECELGEFRCLDNTPQVCQMDGRFESMEPCAANDVCNQSKRTCTCALWTCGNSCTDTATDARNCGKCNYFCPGRCSNSVCQCAAQSAANLVKNGGFDTESLSAWSTKGDITIGRSALDRTGCAVSGSLLATTGGAGGYVYSSCMPVSPGLTCNAGGWANTPSASNRPIITIEWFSSADCASGTTLDNIYAYPLWTTDIWNYIEFDARVPPAGSAGAKFLLSFDNGTEAYFDALFFSPSPTRF